MTFQAGLNLLVGRPNTGKTVWLRMIDYALGDRDSAEHTLSEELATKYDSIRVQARIVDQELAIERKWKVAGAKHKVYMDDSDLDAGAFSARLLERLEIPVLHYPKGDPYAARAWPELSWRTLYRHIYRRQPFWGTLVEKQVTSEQHACILQFLGLAEKLFSPEYGALIDARKCRMDLQAQRDTFMRTLNRISHELLDVDDQVAGLTPDVIKDAVARIDRELNELRTRREAALDHLLSETPEPDKAHVEQLGEERARLLAQHAEAANEMHAADSRLRDISRYKEDIEAELNRLERASVSDRVLANLRITCCPACDRPISGSNHEAASCFLCQRPLHEDPPDEHAGRKRLEIAIKQLRTQRAEAVELVEQLASRQRALKQSIRRAVERIAEIEADLERLRKPAAAILPPALAQADVEAGRLEERRRQWHRLQQALNQREELAGEIATLQEKIQELDEAVDRTSGSVDFESAADTLVDGMNDYLTRLNEARPESWTQDEVSLRLNDRKFEFLVGRERWDRRLGGTLTLYFLLAYQYGLLRLTRESGCHYPGLTIVDMPAELPDVESVSDLENFVLAPFVRLLKEPSMASAQVLVAGSSFEGLEGARRIELDHVYR